MAYPITSVESNGRARVQTEDGPVWMQLVMAPDGALGLSPIGDSNDADKSSEGTEIDQARQPRKQDFDLSHLDQFS